MAKILSLENTGTSNGEGMDTSELEAKYIYVVNGKEYFSKKLAFGYFDLINPFADRLHKRFSGKIYVPVYYNPRDPQQAVLLRGLQSFHITDLIVSGFLSEF